ncbi:MAG: hypothetical protein OSA51_06385 [Octadecabacter sp.]|nr:hypothetical protein [Octadecabacter sp.]
MLLDDIALPALHHVVSAAAAAGHGLPALASAFKFIDTVLIARVTIDLIHAQWDFFARYGFFAAGEF